MKCCINTLFLPKVLKTVCCFLAHIVQATKYFFVIRWLLLKVLLVDHDQQAADMILFDIRESGHEPSSAFSLMFVKTERQTLNMRNQYLDLDVSFVSVAVVQSNWNAVHWFLHQRE